MTRLADLTVFGLTVTVHARPHGDLETQTFAYCPQPHPALVIPDPEESEEVAALALFSFLDWKAGLYARDDAGRARLLFGLLRDNPAWAQRLMHAEAPEHVLVGEYEAGDGERSPLRAN